jgi:hypothetical protein
MSVKRLRAAIDEITSIFSAAGANTQSKTFNALSKLLEGNDDKSIREFFASLNKKPLSGQALIQHYVSKLESPGTDELAFAGIFSELRSNKSIKKAEADAIAAGYTKGRSKWRAKADAIKAIETTFRERAYQAVKMRQVEKASRW